MNKKEALELIDSLKYDIDSYHDMMYNNSCSTTPSSYVKMREEQEAALKEIDELRKWVEENTND